jgi:transposase
MDHFAGLDVSVKETSVCIVDDTGRIVREVKVASEPGALLQVLTSDAYHFKRIGLEAGRLSQWLFSALAEAGLPAICVETRHMRAVLQAQINKTDRNDARGMAQMMRAGLYRPVHVKTLRSQKLRMLLTHRKLLQSKAIAIDNDLCGTLRNFGLKVGIVGTVKFEARIKELVENLLRPTAPRQSRGAAWGDVAVASPPPTAQRPISGAPTTVAPIRAGAHGSRIDGQHGVDVPTFVSRKMAKRPSCGKSEG